MQTQYFYHLAGLKQAPHLNGALCTSMKSICETEDDTRIEATLCVAFKNLVRVRAKPTSLEFATLQPLIPALPDFDKDAASMIMLYCDWNTLKQLSRTSHFWRICALEQLRAWKGPRALVQNSRGSFHIATVLLTLFPFGKWSINTDRRNEDADNATRMRMKEHFQLLEKANTKGTSFDTQPVLLDWSPIFDDANRANDANEFHIHLEMMFQLPKSTAMTLTRTLQTSDGLEMDVRHEPSYYINLPSDSFGMGVTNYMHHMIQVGDVNTFTGNNQYVNSLGLRVDARMDTRLSNLSEMMRIHINRLGFNSDFSVNFKSDAVSFEQTMKIEQPHETTTYALKALLNASKSSANANFEYTYFVMGADDVWYKIQEQPNALPWTQTYIRTTYEEVEAQQTVIMLWYIATP